MSKAKKTAYAEKQKAASEAAAAQKLVPLGESAPAARTPKIKPRKQSRGK